MQKNEPVRVGARTSPKKRINIDMDNYTLKNELCQAGAEVENI